MAYLHSLRGGGVACSCQNQVELPIQQAYNPNVFEIFSKFHHFISIIEQKATLVANQQESADVMIAIQWFIFQEENIYKLNKNIESVKKSYTLILEGIKRLLNSCLIYIKTDSFICLYILQITTSLSKVIFNFHLMNDQRYIEIEDQRQCLGICEKLKLQMEIEKNDLIQNQIELFLFLTQIAFEIAPNNSNEKSEILTGCLSGIVKSVIKMSPDIELLESLFQGAKLIYQEYNNNNKRKQYEVYYQIDMLQWEIIIYFRNVQSKSLEQIILQLEAMYDMIVKGSINWIDHYLWVQMIGKILIYNPLLTKKRLDQVVNSLNLRDQPINQIWEDYKTKGQLIQINYSNDTAVILLNQLQNKKTQQLDKFILECCFKGWENFTMFREFLMNEQQENIQYTFGAYLKQNLDILKNDNQMDQHIRTIDTIQKFLSFMMSDKLLILIKQNFDKLEEIIMIWKSFRTDKIINLKISQNSLKNQIQKVIRNLNDYYQNIQHIMKIICLSLQKTDSQTEQCLQNEFIDYEKLTYLLSLLKQILVQSIEELKDQIFEKQNQQKKKCEQSEFEESEMLFNHIKLIQQDLQNFKIDEKQFLLLDDLLCQLLKNPTISGNKFILEAQKVIKQINQLQEQINKLDIIQFQKYGIDKYFMNLIQRCYCYFEKQYDEIQKDFKDSLNGVKEIFIRYHEIELASTVEKLMQIKEELYNLQLKKLISNSKFNFLKLYLHLLSFKKSFQKMLTHAKPEELKNLILLLNLNKFLIEAIKNYLVRMNNSDTNFEEILAEIKSLGITNKEVLTNQLSQQKGIIQYHLFKLQLEEQQIDQERFDLELIRKEFGEMFTEKSTNYQMIDSIQNVLKSFQIEKSVQIMDDENFNEDQLQIEKELYERLLHELKKIKGSSEIKEAQQLINQTHIVEETFRNSNNKHIQISRIFIGQQLRGLQSQIKQFQDYVKQNNLDIPHQENKKFNSYLSGINFLIKFLKIQRTRIENQKQIFDDILQDFEKFINTQEIIAKQPIEVQGKMFESFNTYTQKKFNRFENLQQINFDQDSNDPDFENLLTFFQNQIDESEQNIAAGSEQLKATGCDQNKSTGNEEEEGREIQEKQLHDSKHKEQVIGNELTNERDKKQIIHFNYFYKLKTFVKKQFTNIKQQFDEVYFDEEFIIIQIKKLYFGEKEVAFEMEEVEEYFYQEKGFFKNYHQKYKDFKNNDEWKIKQGIVFTIIQISSNCFSSQIITFCQTALVQLWGKEKDQRIRNLLKNQSLMSMQMQLLQRDWKTQHDRIEGEMKFMLQKIDYLQEQISHEVNLNQREKQLIELDETTQQLDEYIQNISEMGQQLKLITDFLNHLRKGLTRLERKINDMKNQLNDIGNDVKFLRGKSVTQLLEIRKWKVLKEAASQNVKSIYIPLKTIEKTEKGDWKSVSNLMNLERLDDKEGEVNQFLLEEKDKKQTVLLIHGIAGSGKSTTAKKIEEFIWKLHEKNIKFNNLVLIPIYISLPSLKNPVFEAVEEAIHQAEYGFDELQLKECKEMIEKKQFRFLLIFDGYDEMNLENIQKKLYRSNKLCQNWINPLVIFTTRSEIFSNYNYTEWFAPENKNQLKEIQLLKFDQQQMEQYLQKFTLLSIKVLIYDTYEWSNQMQNQTTIDEKKFEIIWEKLEKQFFKQNQSKIKSESLLNEKQIENILLFLKSDQQFAINNSEAARSLEINLQKLWSVDKYQNIMKMVNIDKLVETPYLMEIIVWVLPSMLAKAKEIVKLKQNFIKNFSKMIKETFKSTFLTEMYIQQKKNLREQNNKAENETSSLVELEKLKKIDYSQPALQIWQIMEQNQILIRFQFDQEFKELKTKLLNIFKDGELQKQIFQDKVIIQFQIKNQKIVELIYNALKEQNLTSFDFYDEFIRQYYLKQIDKQRNLGKPINIDRFLHDLQYYSTKLAKKMSKKQLTQLQYKQQGFLYQDKIEEEWIKEFFNDDGQEGQYKKDIRSCSLTQQKGSTFQFVHKSIQEFLIAADLYKLLVKSRDIDLQIFKIAMEIFKKKDKTYDMLELLSLNNIVKHPDISVQLQTLQLYDKQQKLNHLQQNITKLIGLIQDISVHDLNKVNYSNEIYVETRKHLIKKISKDEHMTECLKFLVRLTAIDERFIQSGSNSLTLLVEMQVILYKMDFQNIQIKHTNIAGGNFARCNLSGSQFDDVNINGVNLNGAILYNCKWQNIRINELHQMIGHKKSVQSICFSPDGTTIASGGDDSSIRLWDVQTGIEKYVLTGHSQTVYSVCYSPDRTTLASCSNDRSIRLWDVQTRKQKSVLSGHTQCVLTVCFSPDGTSLASSSWDNTIRLWNVQTGKQKFILTGHTKYVTSVCFSPDGTTLASGSGDTSIRLWNVQTGKEKSQITGHINNVSSVCFSPDGTTLASGSWDNSIRLWDVQTGKEKSQLTGHINNVSSVCFSPDGTTLASGSWDNSIRVWDVQTGKEKQILTGHTKDIFQICFSPDGTTLASGSSDESVRLWDVQIEKERTLLTGHTKDVLSIIFSPDGQTLASASDDNSIRLWDVLTGKEKSILTGHSKGVLSLCFTADGTTLASGSTDKSIRLWDVQTGLEKAALIGHTNFVSSVCFSPDGTTLASGSWDNSIRLWDALTGKKKSILTGHTYNVSSVCFSPDGTTLASGSWDNSILLWDLNTEKEKNVLTGHANGVFQVCFSPDGTTLASCSDEICFWDVQTGEQKLVLTGYIHHVFSICFSPDGSTLASGIDDYSIRLWEVKTGKEKSILTGHTKDVCSLCYSPDGTTLASASVDKSIRLWELQTRKDTSVLSGHSNSIFSVTFSPDGKSVASGSMDKSIRIWDVCTGEEILKLNDNTDILFSVCYSPDGTTLASGSMDQSIRLWDVQTGKEKCIFTGHTGLVVSVCFSPDGTILASGSFDKSIRLWDVMTGKEKFQLNGHLNNVNSVCFSPDGITLASGSGDNSICLWDLKTGNQQSVLNGHTDNVYSVCYSPDGSTLASGSDDQSIRLWDVKAGKEKSVLIGHTNGVYSVCFSPDGITLASGSKDKSIRLWNMQTGKEKSVLTGHNDFVFSVCFSTDGTNLASGSVDKTIRLWTMKTGNDTSVLTGHTYNVSSVCISPDRTTLASGSFDQSIRLWDLNTGKEKFVLTGHTDDVTSVCFSPDSITLASGSKDYSIRIWDVQTGEEKSVFIGHMYNVYSVCFSPDGKTLVSGSFDKSIRLWDVQTGEEQSQLTGHTNDVLSVTFSPDGTIVASGSRDNSIRLWDVQTGEEKSVLNGHTESVNSVCYSPNGNILTSCSNDRSIRLWDVQTGKEKFQLNGHSDDVYSVCFSPDGTTLASGSYDKTSRLWNVQTGKEMSFLTGHTKSVNSVYFSPDGTTLASGSDDKSIRIYDLKPINQNNLDIPNNIQVNQKYINTIINSQIQNSFTLISISREQQFKVSGTLIYEEQILNHLKINLRLLFEQKGCINLNKLLK